MHKENQHTNTTYFSKAARNFYFLAIVSFTLCLSLNQTEYFKESLWTLILTDSASVLLIYIGLILYLTKKIGLKLTSAVYVYTTLINLAISTWYYFYYHIDFTGNFLISTFIYCINTVVAGFCIGRKHAFITAGLYVVSFGPLLTISHDNFLNENSIAIVFLIVAFSLGVSGFLNVLERTHNEELVLKDEIFEKDKTIAEQQNKRLNFELYTKQKEIAAKAMFIVEYTESNNAFVRKLRSLKSGMKKKEQQLLDEIIHEHSVAHHNSYWKEFEASFLDVHPDFYKKLYKVCSELTPSELKLASLIHLGLSSKQIGSITSTEPESVDVARSRLRRKLNLPPDVNLRTFLMGI